MIAAAGLLAYAVVVATTAASVLNRLDFHRVSPTSQIVAWITTATSSIVAFVAGAALLCGSLWHSMDIVTACSLLLRHAIAGDPPALWAVLGLSLVALTVGRLLGCATQAAWTITIGRRRQRQRLDMLARPHPSLPGVLVLDQDEALAFCIPRWRGGRVVVTTGATALLTPAELTATVEHERAHLSAKHDVLVAVANLLRQAFPFVPLFREAATVVPSLVEMAADQRAVRRSDRRSLASALVRLADASVPAGALGAGGPTVSDRVRWLLTPAPSDRLCRAWLAGLVGLVAVASPLAIAVLSPVTACPLSMT